MNHWESTATYKRLKEELNKTYRYYYNRLNKDEKDFYLLFYKGILNFEKTIILPYGDYKKYEKIYINCFLDNPLFFYLKTVNFSISRLHVRVDIIYLMDWSKCEQVYSKIFSEMDSVRKKARHLTDLEKEHFVHQYIIDNVTYELNDRLPIHSAHSLFMYSKAVCDGISKAAKILLDALKVKSIVILGRTSNQNITSITSGDHAWNVIWIDDKPYHTDFTFDLTLSQKEFIRCDYFNLNDEQIKKDHSFIDIGIISNGNNDWFINNNLFFSKKSILKSYVAQEVKKETSFIYFKIPFTVNPQITIQNILNLCENEIINNINNKVKLRYQTNETQMIIHINLIYIK